MKIRSDFVSNSSSSSFVLFGTKHEGSRISIEDMSSVDSVRNGRPDKITIDDFSDLEPDEAFFIILRNAGSEGDYIFRLTPELLMDCDMHQIDLYKFIIVRAKYYMTESGYIYRANQFGTRDEWSGTDDYLGDKIKRDGLPVDGLRVFRYSKDYGNPSDRSEILESLERHAKYS